MIPSPITKGLIEITESLEKELKSILSDICDDITIQTETIRNTYQIKEISTGKIFMENEYADVYELSFWFLEKMRENPEQYYEPFKKYMNWLMGSVHYLV